jgi:hypothetical protein
MHLRCLRFAHCKFRSRGAEITPCGEMPYGNVLRGPPKGADAALLQRICQTSTLADPSGYFVTRMVGL